jgi:hypothetical protein
MRLGKSPARSLLVEQLAGNQALIGRPFRPEDEGQVTIPTPSPSQRRALRLGSAAAPLPARSRSPPAWSFRSDDGVSWALTARPLADDGRASWALREKQRMNREELSALRDAIDAVLAWPESVCDQVARWLAPEASKPSGRDPHPPRIAPTGHGTETGQFQPQRAAPTPRPAGPGPRPTKARIVEASEAKTRAAERRLLDAPSECQGQ